MSWTLTRQKRRPANYRKSDEMLSHLDAAYTFAKYLTRDQSMAEDAVQEAFLGAMSSSFGAETPDTRVSVLTFVRNTCLEKRRHGHFTSDGANNVPPLDHALYSLAPEFREVLLLRERCELTYSQISRVVNEPVGIVMSRLSRARIRLYEKLLSRRQCPAELR